MYMRQPITYAEASDLLIYEQDSGLLRWKVNNGRSARKGNVAGCLHKNTGYWQIGIRNFVAVPAHRLAWLLYHGKWPDGVIDHINGDKSDNRISNLRDVPPLINLQNLKKPIKGNSSGFLGVSIGSNGMWRAQIHHNRKQIYLGLFSTPEDAHDAYLTAKRDLHAGNTL